MAKCLMAALALLALAAFLAPVHGAGGERERAAYDVRDFGAAGDGKTMDTKAIQAAIDACAKAGGGTVSLRGGRFLSGPLTLRSHITLDVERGATLLGSPDPKDYPENPHALPSRFSKDLGLRSLITAEKAENVAIVGGGTIDGQGLSTQFREQVKKNHAVRFRPLILRFSECRNVRIRDVTLTHSAGWLQNYLACEDVVIDGVTVDNVGLANTDGLDLDGCRNVRVSNCQIVSYDDALCLKSTSERPCENITVTNCVLSSRCNAIKCGTDSSGGFVNLCIANCVVYDTHGAISLEVVDGGTMDRVVVSGIVMNNVANPIFLRLGNRGRGQEKPTPGALRNVILRDIQATEVTNLTGCSITGQPGHPVENVSLSDIRIRFKGGGKREDIKREIPEWPDRYPEFFMFGPPNVPMWEDKSRETGRLPAYGFYVRHARNVTLDRLALGFDAPDARPALFFDDAVGIRVSSLEAQSTPDTPALIWLKQSQSALISGCQPRNKKMAFVHVEGDKSADISLAGNDLREVRTAADLDDSAPKGAVVPASSNTAP